jgi:hypothetical protein
LEAHPEGIDTRVFALHVIEAKGLDASDRHLRKAIAYKVVQCCAGSDGLPRTGQVPPLDTHWHRRPGRLPKPLPGLSVVWWAMPFTPYRASLDPYARAAAQDAFDLAWPEIRATGGYDMQLARYLLAKRIVEAAMEGERDPERLKAYALEGFKP